MSVEACYLFQKKSLPNVGGLYHCKVQWMMAKPHPLQTFPSKCNLKSLATASCEKYIESYHLHPAITILLFSLQLAIQLQQEEERQQQQQQRRPQQVHPSPTRSSNTASQAQVQQRNSQQRAESSVS